MDHRFDITFFLNHKATKLHCTLLFVFVLSEIFLLRDKYLCTYVHTYVCIFASFVPSEIILIWCSCDTDTLPIQMKKLSKIVLYGTVLQFLLYIWSNKCSLCGHKRLLSRDWTWRILKAQTCLLVELDKQDIRMSERMTNRPVSNQIVKAVLSRLQSVFIKYQTWEVHSNLLIKPLLDFGPFCFWEAENRPILGWNTIIWKSGIWGCKNKLKYWENIIYSCPNEVLSNAYY